MTGWSKDSDKKGFGSKDTSDAKAADAPEAKAEGELKEEAKKKPHDPTKVKDVKKPEGWDKQKGTRAWQEGEHTATTAYYLAALRMQRYDFIAAWGAFSEAETLVTSRDHDPKALKGLKQQMLSMCPRP